MNIDNISFYVLHHKKNKGIITVERKDTLRTFLNVPRETFGKKKLISSNYML
jgi:hypothetical protein